MKQKLKKVGFAATLLVMLLTCLSVSAETEGDFTYTVSDGNAVITKYSSDESNVVIPDTLGGYKVTGIGDSAFLNLTKIKSITIPASITHMDYGAFMNCTIEQINIPSIESWLGITFETNKESSNPLYTGNAYLYIDGKAVTDIVIPSTVETVPDMAFYNYKGLKSLTVSNGVKTIGKKAFQKCSNLSDITISGNVQKVDDYAFSDCTQNKRITITDNCDNISGITAGIPNITEAIISDGITSIGKNAFRNCTALSYVTIPNSVQTIESAAFIYCNSLSNVILPEGVKTINGGFDFCTGLESITIPSTVTDLSSFAFNSCKNLKSVNIGTLAQWLNLNMDSGSSNPLNNGTAILYIGNTPFTELNVPSDVTVIKPYLFYNYAALSSFKGHSKLKEIGTYSFYGCSGLTSLVVPESVSVLGDHSFEKCTGITELTIAGNLADVGSWVFKDCTTLKTVTLTKGITFESIAGATDNALSKYSFNSDNIERVVLSNVRSIPAYAFRNLSGLKSIEIPNTVRTIGEKAFYKCTSLESVTIPSKVKSIEYATFYGCKALASVTLSEGVTGIGEAAFDGCSALKSISIPGTVQSIGSLAFRECKAMEALTLAYGIESIKNSAFAGCENLLSVDVPNSVTSLEKAAFANCYSLEQVKLSDNITKINDAVFSNCTKLVKVWIPANATISDNSFYNCICDLYCETSLEDYTDKNPDLLWVDTSSISDIIVYPPEKVTYKEGEALDLTGLYLTVRYEDGEWDFYDGFEVSGYDSSKIGKQTVSVKYKNKIVTFDITVKSAALTESTVSPTDNNYNFNIKLSEAKPGSVIAVSVTDAEGRLLDIRLINCSDALSYSVSVPKKANASKAYIFTWKSIKSMSPYSKKEMLELN